MEKNIDDLYTNNKTSELTPFQKEIMKLVENNDKEGIKKILKEECIYPKESGFIYQEYQLRELCSKEIIKWNFATKRYSKNNFSDKPTHTIVVFSETDKIEKGKNWEEWTKKL